LSRADWTFFVRPLFWVYTISNVIQRLGYFFSSLYLPLYAALVGLSTIKGALLLVLMSISQVCGQFTFGLSIRSSDFTKPSYCNFIACSPQQQYFEGLAHALATLVIFPLVDGFFGAGYVAMVSPLRTGFGSIPSNHFNQAYGGLQRMP
jgi:hypothetical protein